MGEGRPARAFSDGATLLVSQALELEVADQGPFLDRACGADAALRAEVEALLEAERDLAPPDFLEVPAVAGLLRNQEPGRLPENVGRYRILDRLGEGGMGTVYLAEQEEPVRRRVALKVIRVLHRRHLRRRFAAECQALARLNHPSIAAMYEVGTTDDSEFLPWVAMEYVDGETITRYCDRARLGVVERLRIFLGVCGAIRHAHEKGLLHCDLKPGNVLVTEVEGTPLPKVIDFGIARAVDEPLIESGEGTREMVLGSPPYISPEATRAGGRHHLDARTDVYSLGLLLYELLVGNLPFETPSSDLLSFVREIHECDAAAPSRHFASLAPPTAERLAAQRGTEAPALARRLRGDLDAIVGKAVSRDPTRRYGSPADLAADLERHLGHRPIEARPPTTSYLLGRFARRHVGGVITATLLTGALVSGLIARSIEAERARKALAESEQVRRFMVELFQASNPEQTQSEELTVRELLDQGATRLRGELVDQPEARARFLQTIGSIYTKLGELESAADVIAEALAIRQDLHPPDHPEILESQSEAGVIFRRLGRYDEAEPLLRAVLEARLADRGTQRELLARAHSNLGNLLWSAGRFEQAETHHRQALEIRDENAARLGTPDSRFDAGLSAINLGATLLARERWMEARPVLLRAIESFESGNPAYLGAALNNLGLVERNLPSWPRAEERFREALAVQEGIWGPSHIHALAARRNIVAELLRRRRFDAAIAEATVAVGHAAAGDDAMTFARVQASLGRALRAAGRPDEAVAVFRRGIEIAAGSHGPAHPVALEIRTLLARALASRRDTASALAELRDVARHQEAAQEDVGGPALARTEGHLGMVLLEADRPAEAEPHLRRAWDADRQSYGALHPKSAIATHSLARALGALSRVDEATELLRDALEVRRRTYGNLHPDVADTALELASLEERRGRIGEARDLLRLAVDARAFSYPRGDAELAAARTALARLGG